MCYAFRFMIFDDIKKRNGDRDIGYWFGVVRLDFCGYAVLYGDIMYSTCVFHNQSLIKIYTRNGKFEAALCKVSRSSPENVSTSIWNICK